MKVNVIYWSIMSRKLIENSSRICIPYIDKSKNKTTNKKKNMTCLTAWEWDKKVCFSEEKLQVMVCIPSIQFKKLYCIKFSCLVYTLKQM